MNNIEGPFLFPPITFVPFGPLAFQICGLSGLQNRLAQNRLQMHSGLDSLNGLGTKRMKGLFKPFRGSNVKLVRKHTYRARNNGLHVVVTALAYLFYLALPGSCLAMFCMPSFPFRALYTAIFFHLTHAFVAFLSQFSNKRDLA